MKCNNCGFESEQNFEYCANCGTRSVNNNYVPVEPISLNPAADKIMGALKDNMFLVLCILMSASCVLSLSGGLPLINILITIFLWLTYADVQKDFVNEKHLQSISGTVYANYIITNVACGILIACGVLLGAMNNVIDGAELLKELWLEFENLGISSDLSDLMSQEMLRYLGIMIAIIFVIIGVIGVIFNVLLMRKIHRFAKSVYQGIMYQNPNFENPKVAKNVLFFFGICSAVSAVLSLVSGSITSALATGCTAASEIIAYILIDKYLISKTNFIV